MLNDTVALRCTVLLPVIRPPYFLPNAIERVLAQTVREFELFIVCDGAPPETIECAHDFARRDSRVKVFTFPKGRRVGEAHRHTALTNASGNFVAYLEDDDLWFPNHLEELEKLLLTVDFGHTIHVTGHTDGNLESLMCDIGNEDFRQRFLDDLFNRFGYSFCGHRLDAYRRLPEGWAPTPVGMWPDLHMWRKFLRMSEFKFGTRMAITAVSLPGFMREHMSVEERVREAGVWVSRIVDEHERANIVEGAWRSAVGKEIQREEEILEIESSFREAKAALAQMEAMHPGSLQKLGPAIEVQANAQLEVKRITDLYDLSQQCLSIFTAKTEAQEAEIAAYQVDLASLNGTLANAELEVKRITDLSHRSVSQLTGKVDAQGAAIKAYQLEIKRITDLHNLSQQSLSQLTARIEAQEASIASYEFEVKRITDLYDLSQQALSLLTARTEAQEAAIAAHQVDIANLNGTLAERQAAYERIVRTRSWRITQPLRSADAAVRHLSQILRRSKMRDR
jgi:glycosyltransferase involved in cell wall biosynthesis